MNMILHNKPTAEIYQGNVLSDPQWKETNGQLKRFDFIVANPPFSTKNWISGLDPSHDEYNRFVWGIPPEKNGDYAFLMHVLASLKSTGKAAIILPHGVLFRGNAKARIRENIIKQGYIKGIIGFPANLFYGTGIPACVLVLDKENANTREGIFMIDASQGFVKDGNKNRLRSQDIHKIVTTFNHQIEIEGYSRMVTMDEIEKHEYNLNIPRYIDSSEPEDLHDLTAHLKGGMPDAERLGKRSVRDTEAELNLKIFEYYQKLTDSEIKQLLVDKKWRFDLSSALQAEIERLIVEDEQQGEIRAEYGKQQLQQLSHELTQRYGKGFDISNLRYMRLFYQAFPIRDALRHNLSWTHYRTLLRVENPSARQWYLEEAINQNWSTRALDRQISKLYYEHLLASQEKILVETEAKSHTDALKDDIKNYLRDPYILDFLNLQDKTYQESDVEQAIISNIQQFLLELGKGFAFVERQQRIRFDDEDF